MAKLFSIYILLRNIALCFRLKQNEFRNWRVCLGIKDNYFKVRMEMKNPQIPSIPEILTNFKAILAGITIAMLIGWLGFTIRQITK